ncbi:hypothetical protein [Sediminimonas sp.]|uniref:hypothetical protein n=1 Tax=Sediminimonas sp. TaxID=2823379 RepID=UPI0025D7FC61|nr:hypothetical protein [Sediminimonas sp.]
MFDDISYGEFNADDIRDFVLRERGKAVSSREWKHRLAGYGYRLTETDRGYCVTSVLGGEELCRLPGQAAA